MANVWAENDAEVELRLQRWIDGEADGPSAAHIKPFTNDVTPDPDDEPGDYDTDASLTCPDDTIGGDNWDTITINDHVATTVNTDTRTWTRSTGSGSITVYGYVVLNDDESEVRWAERFANPRTLFNGDQIDLTATRRERTAPSS